MPKFYPDLENSSGLLIGNLLDTYLLTKDLKSALGKRILFTKADGKVYESKALAKPVLAQALAGGEAKLKARLNGSVEILNLLPFERALELYRIATKPEYNAPSLAEALASAPATETSLVKLDTGATVLISPNVIKLD